MTVYRQLPEVAEILGAPFTPEYLRRHLNHGVLQGIGGKFGGSRGPWILTDADIEAVVERHRVAQEQPQHLDPEPPALASGVSPRSRRMKQMREAG